MNFNVLNCFILQIDNYLEDSQRTSAALKDNSNRVETLNHMKNGSDSKTKLDHTDSNFKVGYNGNDLVNSIKVDYMKEEEPAESSEVKKPISTKKVFPRNPMPLRPKPKVKTPYVRKHNYNSGIRFDKLSFGTLRRY